MQPGTLGHDFRYPIAHEFQRTLEDPAIQPSYPRSLREFRVSEVRVGAEELVLVVEFELTVK